MDILFYNMFYIIKTMKKQTLLYHVRTYDIKKVQILTCPPPYPPSLTSQLFVTTPLYNYPKKEI